MSDKSSDYKNREIFKVQELEKEILKEFVDICNKEGFLYFISYGSLIGAIRHKGFIPWDDDIDISMPRKDYERFLAYAKANLQDKYNIINIYEYADYPLTTTQLSLKNTSFVVEPFKDIDNIPFGVFLDIFPMDFVSDNDRIMKKQNRRAFVYGKLMILCSIKKPYLPCGKYKKMIIHFFTACVYYILKLFKISGRKMNDRIDGLVKDYRDGTKRIRFMNSSLQFYDSILNWNDVFPTIPVQFEDITVQAPREYDKYLRALYGDYMQIPPEDKRVSHCPVKLEL